MGYLMGIYMGVRDAIRFLVAKAMCGKENVLMALMEYARFSDSLSVIADRYGISKHTLRGTMSRLKTHAGNNGVAITLIEKAIPEIMGMGVERVIETRDGTPYCRRCRTYIINVFPEDHLVKKHQDELDNIVSEVIERIRSKRNSNVRAVSA